MFWHGWWLTLSCNETVLSTCLKASYSKFILLRSNISLSHVICFHDLYENTRRKKEPFIVVSTIFLHILYVCAWSIQLTENHSLRIELHLLTLYVSVVSLGLYEGRKNHWLRIELCTSCLISTWVYFNFIASLLMSKYVYFRFLCLPLIQSLVTCYGEYIRFIYCRS